MGWKDRLKSLKQRVPKPKPKKKKPRERIIKQEYYVVEYRDKRGWKRRRTAKTYTQARKIATELATKGYRVEIKVEAKTGKIVNRVSTKKILKEAIAEGIKKLEEEEKKSRKKKGGKKRGGSSRKTQNYDPLGLENIFNDKPRKRKRKNDDWGLPDLI